MNHRLHLIDLLISLLLAVGARPHLNLVTTYIEYRMVRWKGRLARETSDYVAPKEIPENRIIPDAAFVLENTKTHRRGLFFIEMDMGTETIISKYMEYASATLHHKMRQYDRYLQSGQFSKKYERWGEFRFFTLLFVTISATHVDNIRRHMLDLPAKLHQYYYFNTYDIVKENFFNTQWKRRSIRDNRGYPIIRE